ncbi:MAG: hypothetical protein WC412_01615 [Candidatus Omnitrophota bacterium]|jgi:hypothetical protein
MVYKITLDTNCFFEYFERNPENIEKLITFQNEGKIEIGITTRVQADTFGKRQDSPIWQQIKSFHCVTVGSVGRWDVSYWDSGDVFGGEEESKLQELIQSCIGKNAKKINDVDHLIGHIINKRDIFVTNDEDDFIKHRDCLQQKCNVRILTLKECIEFLIS